MQHALFSFSIIHKAVPEKLRFEKKDKSVLISNVSEIHKRILVS